MLSPQDGGQERHQACRASSEKCWKAVSESSGRCVANGQLRQHGIIRKADRLESGDDKTGKQMARPEP